MGAVKTMSCSVEGSPAGGKLLRLCRRCSEFFQTETLGSSMVEFALVAPMVLAMFTGICAFGVAFNNQLTLNRAVGFGAQYLQIDRTTAQGPKGDPCADTFKAITGAAPNLTAGSIVMTLATGTIQTPAGTNTCAGYGGNLVQGQAVTVTATYPCALFIYGSKALSGCKLSAMVTEYEY